MNLWKMNCGISALWIDNESRWSGIWPLKYTRISYQLFITIFIPKKPTSSSIWLFFSHDTNIHLNETAPMMMPGSTFLLGPFPGHIYHQSQHRLNNRKKNYIYSLIYYLALSAACSNNKAIVSNESCPPCLQNRMDSSSNMYWRYLPNTFFGFGLLFGCRHDPLLLALGCWRWRPFLAHREMTQWRGAALFIWNKTPHLTSE